MNASQRGTLYFRAVLLLLVALSIAAPAVAGMEIFMSVTGSQQGLITGDSNDDQHTNWIELESYTDSMYVPLDSKNLPSSSQRIQRPFQIVKSSDSSTPKLYKALRTKERLSQVVIQVHRDAGEKDILEEYILQNATVVSLSGTVPDLTLMNPVQMVGFTFQCITRKRYQYSDTWVYLGSTSDMDCLY